MDEHPPRSETRNASGPSISERRARATAHEQLGLIDARPRPLKGWQTFSWEDSAEGWYFVGGGDDDDILHLVVGPEVVTVWSTDDYADIMRALTNDEPEKEPDPWDDEYQAMPATLHRRPWTLGEVARWKFRVC